MKTFEFGILMLGSLGAAIGQLLLKNGAAGRQHWLEFINMPLISGLTLYVLATGCWIYGLSKLPLIMVYPFTVLTFCFVLLIGVFFLGEKMSLPVASGVLLIFGGLYLIMKNGVS